MAARAAGCTLGLACAWAGATEPGAAWQRALQAGVPGPAWMQAMELARAQAAAHAPPDARVVVQPGLLDARLRLAPCAEVTASVVPSAPPHGRTRVALLCSGPPAGQTAWRVHLPLNVQVWAPAWVARAPLQAGQVLQPEHLERTETDWTARPVPPLPAQATAPPWGRTLARALPAGAALRGGDLQQRRWFGHGQTVRVLVQGEGFAVVSQGEALGDGIEGRPARVRLPGGRVLTGRPVGEQQMQVML